MSWLDKIQSDFIITTGDGKQFKVLWMNATKQVEYNVAEFEFPNLEGTLVWRGKPKGRRYNLEIFFQGENHIDNSKAFEISAADNRPWTIAHPLYGNMIVQPIVLSFDNTQMNVTKITGQVVETITQDNPITTVNPIDNIRLDKENLDISFTNSLTSTPSSQDIQNIKAANKSNYNISVPIIKVPEEAEAYFNLYNAANSAITNAVASPLIAMQAVQAFYNYPALFTTDVKSRIDLLSSQFNILREGVGSINTQSGKQTYQIQGGAIISSQAIAAATPQPGNYTNMKSVLLIMETILKDYNNFLIDIDSLQTPNGGNVDSFIPDPDAIIGLGQMINYTITSLFNIALNSKQERTIILEDDSNIILLTHRLYGLDPFDNNIDELISNNDFGIDDMLIIRKGTPIVYYI
jgi:hypothetical protein